jgi:hypothetical protein
MSKYTAWEKSAAEEFIQPLAYVAREFHESVTGIFRDQIVSIGKDPISTRDDVEELLLQARGFQKGWKVVTKAILTCGYPECVAREYRKLMKSIRADLGDVNDGIRTLRVRLKALKKNMVLK